MTKNDIQKKRTTVFSADAAGYSRLMCRDEITTVITLTRHREIMTDLVEAHQGRVVDAVGDNLMAEFHCAADAVTCALAVQQKLHDENTNQPEDRQMWFRIGINYGDVIAAGKRIYGTGVNISARLESMADPGGICISREVLERVKPRMPLQVESMGQYRMKNMCRPIDLYRIVPTHQEDPETKTEIQHSHYKED
ncbi:MAG: adenylate/guanylate cyclase domain-containing protein [Desulfotignum sp.]|nr:adenylate/guanylate cyclase domain-containing protein [Desulfotignum sp.]